MVGWDTDNFIPVMGGRRTRTNISINISTSIHTKRTKLEKAEAPAVDSSRRMLLGC